MVDNIKLYHKEPLIVNTDLSSGPGIHWIVLYPVDNICYIFDPLGENNYRLYDNIKINKIREYGLKFKVFQAPAGEAAAIDEEDRIQDDEEVASQREPPQNEATQEDFGDPFLVYDPVSTLFFDWDLIKGLPPESREHIQQPISKGRNNKHIYYCLRCDSWFT